MTPQQPQSKEWEDKIRSDYAGILSPAQIEATLEYWSTLLAEEHGRIVRLVDGYLEGLWGGGFIHYDGINEPYIVFRGGEYSFDGVIDDIKQDIKALLDTKQNNNEQ